MRDVPLDEIDVVIAFLAAHPGLSDEPGYVERMQMLRVLLNTHLSSTRLIK